MNEAWYKKYWKILLAGLGLILTGVLVALSGRTSVAKKNVNKLNKAINDIDAEQTLKELEVQKNLAINLDLEKQKLEQEQKLIKAKMSSSPQYDPTKSEAENLDTLRKVTW